LSGKIFIFKKKLRFMALSSVYYNLIMLCVVLNTLALAADGMVNSD